MKKSQLPNYSVLMSVYYKEKSSYLATSIDSMLSQTLKPNDFVLVCDGPLSDDLNKTINQFKQSNEELFQVIRLEKNMGLGEALNIGLEHCKNEIVARMDSDDVALPFRCEKQLQLMKEKKADIISGSVIEFEGDFDTMPNSCWINGKRMLPESHESIISFSKKRNPFNHPATIFVKSQVEKAGGYNEKYHLFEDYHLWVRMLINGCIAANIREPLVYMRINSETILRRGGWHYAKNMLRFHKWLKNIGWIKTKDFITGALPHAVVCVLPNCIRKRIYRILRKDK